VIAMKGLINPGISHPKTTLLLQDNALRGELSKQILRARCKQPINPKAPVSALIYLQDSWSSTFDILVSLYLSDHERHYRCRILTDNINSKEFDSNHCSHGYTHPTNIDNVHNESFLCSLYSFSLDNISENLHQSCNYIEHDLHHYRGGTRFYCVARHRQCRRLVDVLSNDERPAREHWAEPNVIVINVNKSQQRDLHIFSLRSLNELAFVSLMMEECFQCWCITERTKDCMSGEIVALGVHEHHGSVFQLVAFCLRSDVLRVFVNDRRAVIVVSRSTVR
jgi:hypothetical protein